MIKPYLRKPREGTETLVRLKRWRTLHRKMVGKLVRIYSNEHELYWRAAGAGYTADGLEAGVYTFQDAFARTRHCDPSKGITFRLVDTQCQPPQVG